jgi:hypothetical protein
MMRFFIGCLLFLALSRLVPASIDGPATSYFAYADTIYLVHVISVEKDLATFSITEDLRGKPLKILTLKTEFPAAFTPNTDWLLVSCSPWREVPRGDVVGDFFKGTVGWRFAPVVQATDKNDSTALTPDNIRLLVKQNPEKPWPK